jgi:hypothetical protein
MFFNASNSTPSVPARFVAVGHNGLRMTSDNGTNWSAPQYGKEGEVYRAVRFGGGRCLAVGTFGGKNIFAVSTDGGTTWKQADKDGQYSKYVRGLTYGADSFVAVGGDPGSVGAGAPFVLFSEDGSKWGEYQEIEGKNILRRVAYGTGPDGKGLFVGVGDRGRRSASPDGKTWTSSPNQKAVDTLVDIAFGTPGGKGLYVGVGLHGLRMSSVDGINWSERLKGEEGEHLNAIVWTGDRFVAVGLGATYSSKDGVDWQRKENFDAPFTLTYGQPTGGKGLFLGANWKGRLLASEDAFTWKQVHKAEHHIEAVAFG